MVCMEVSQKRRRDVNDTRAERRDAVLISGCGASNHSWSEINQVRFTVGNDDGGRARTLRIRTRRACTEHDNLCGHYRGFHLEKHSLRLNVRSLDYLPTSRRRSL